MLLQIRTILFALLFSNAVFLKSQDFRASQLNFERPKDAKDHCEKRIKKLFKDSGFAEGPKYIYWRSFKMEDELELWATDSSNKPYKKIKTFKICRGSGDLGPKRKLGDLQVPEGMYYIEKYNPNSSFHLSMKVSYPNESDVILGDKENPGNEIYIHGGCASIGCLPMTDSIIEEIYWINVMAQSYQGKTSKIPIDIFPCKFTAKNWKYLKTNYGHRPSLIEFWKNIEEAYDFFEKHKIAPGYWVDQKGKYNVLFPQNYHINDPNH